MFRAYKRYADFRGRSGRREYWFFILWYFLAVCAALVLDSLLFDEEAIHAEYGVTGPFYVVVGLVHLVPALAALFRRLHDTGRTAWWALIGLIPIVGGIVLLVFACLKGDPGENRFGPPDSGEPNPEPVGTVA